MEEEEAIPRVSPPAVHTEEAGGLLEAKFGLFLGAFRNLSQATLAGRGIKSCARRKKGTHRAQICLLVPGGRQDD